ncbi:hypothetical protein [Acinetobacter sp. NyZ410]|uniref:hypothetical protein n=1 Tax=Acinetobacter sp. NyZ410 TaxID=2929509 RepID=UPI001FBC094B|nr:hypothetical protein [Acinetobacter sp. NyZ410]UOH20440.1 hypothetical protein MTO68_09920 [Acinetobacter sp. NyZ410]
MAVNIRFDYYHLRADKSRLRRKDNAQYFFGEISILDFCQKLESYLTLNKKDFNIHGKIIKEFNSGKKWIKWVSIDKIKDGYKLLFTFNDLEVDPRILENAKNNVLTQKIPKEHGLRTLLHVIIKTNPVSKTESNLCVQAVAGMSFKFLPALITELFNLIYPDNFWSAKDPMSQENIKCKPQVDISAVTTSSIIEAVNRGLLQSITLVEETKVTQSFDQNSVLKKQTKSVGITVEDNHSFLSKLTPITFKKWLDQTKNNYKKEFSSSPKTYLMIKNLHNDSETKYEFIDDVTLGLTKRAYLNWADRDINTINGLESEQPNSIRQCFAIMQSNF